AETIVAYRNNTRWVQFMEPLHLKEQPGPPTQLREAGVYLITGGLGGIALELAVYLAQTVKAKLILLARSEMPPRTEWNQWLATHGGADSISQRIKKLLAVEEHGGKALILRG